MAVSKFWPVRTNLRQTMDYVVNPEKTEADAISDDLSQVLAYAQDEKKTEKLFTGFYQELWIQNLLQTPLKLTLQ